ncbi:MAG: ribosome maturation factor RimM [Salaquimonas sp.]
MAKIGAAHGIKGEVRVKSFTDDPLAFGDYGKLHDNQGRKYQVINARVSKTVVVTRFKSVDTREKAEALNGIELFVDRSILPETEDEDEFYMSDLVGLEAVSPDGEKLGVVKEVYDFGAGDILEIKLENGPLEMFPFTKAIFPQIDIEGGRVVFVPPVVVSEREGEA